MKVRGRQRADKPLWNELSSAANVMDDSHTKSSEEILAFFQTDEESGFSDEQIQQAQEKYGPNGVYVYIHGRMCQ